MHIQDKSASIVYQLAKNWKIGSMIFLNRLTMPIDKLIISSDIYYSDFSSCH